MEYRPSTDNAINRHRSSPLWDAIETPFGNAVPITSLKRGSFLQFSQEYIRHRTADENRSLDAYLARLPRSIEALRPGITDAEVIDCIVNGTTPSILALVGPAGAGKSSLLHFIEGLQMTH
jgi:flagellar biosynthesis GTPase FlhF